MSEKLKISADSTIANSFNFELIAKISGRRDFLKHRKWLLESWKLSCFGRKTSKWYPFYTSKISIVSDLSVSQKSPDLIENLKISADSAFSFWTIEQKRKCRIGRISEKGPFRRRQNDETHFSCKESIEN